MDLVISFSPDEEKRLVTAAKQRGIAPEKLVKQTMLEQLPQSLPPTPAHVREELFAKLRLWQQQTNTPVRPHVPAHELFARWEAEDSLRTEEQIEADERLWEEIEKGIAENGGKLSFRTSDQW